MSIPLTEVQPLSPDHRLPESSSGKSSTEDPAQLSSPATNGLQLKTPVPGTEELQGTRASYGQTASISRPELDIRTPAATERRVGTAPAGLPKPSGDPPQFTFRASSLTKGATLQYLNSSRPQSASDAKGPTLQKGRSVVLIERAQRPSTGRKLPRGQL